MVQEEPVVTAGAVAGALGAILVMLVSLGVIDLTGEQQAAIMGAVVAVLPIVMALWARAQVTPLADPRDEDGEALTRYDGMPSLRLQEKMGVRIIR